MRLHRRNPYIDEESHPRPGSEAATREANPTIENEETT
jgi:hypothetical protein